MRARIERLEMFIWNHYLDSNLTGIVDRIPYLKISAEQIHMRILAADGATIDKRTVNGYLWHVAMIFYGVVASDLLLDHLDHVKFYLGRKFHSYYHSNSPPTYICPTPIGILQDYHHCLNDSNTHHCAITDLHFIAFLFFYRRENNVWGGGWGRGGQYSLGTLTVLRT